MVRKTIKYRYMSIGQGSYMYELYENRGDPKFPEAKKEFDKLYESYIKAHREEFGKDWKPYRKGDHILV